MDILINGVMCVIVMPVLAVCTISLGAILLDDLLGRGHK